MAEFERDGKKYTLVHAKQDEMGMTAAAAITMKLTYEFRPKYIIMVGIVAGIALKEVAEQMYGDVMCAGLAILMFFVCVAITKGVVKLTKKMMLKLKSAFIRKEA